ncbi:MAG: glycosyltransferase family 9 protein [Pirellulaceae bacterium]|nr:glycosyltransferase family 9 protein [Pirellulaceae bacterium]
MEERWAPLLEGNQFVDEIVTVNRKSLSSIIELRRRLQESAWDFAVDFQGLIKSALLSSFARPERLYGFARAHLRESLAAMFYSHTLKPRETHVVDRNLELARLAGATAIAKAFPLPPGRPEGDLPAGDFVLASPFAGWASKQWPLEHFAELGHRLQVECGLPLVLNLAPSESVLAHSPGKLATNIGGLSGLIYATRRATAIVGVDSGPLHLAAALAKPGVAIFGPTDPARNGPYGATITVLRSPAAVTTYKRGPVIDLAMRAISVEQVLESLKLRLACPARS